LFLWAAAYVFLSLSLIHLVTRGGSAKRLVYRILFLVAGLCLVGFFFWDFWLGIAGLIHFLFLFSILRFDLVANVYRLGLETFLTLFYASLIAASIVAASSYQAAEERLVQAKVAFANQELLATDGQTTLFLDDIFARLKNDLFIQNRLADPLLSKDPVISKIRKIYLDNYFDQFEVVIRVFSPTGVQIGGTLEGKSFKELQEEYVKSDFATQVPNLYFVPGVEQTAGNTFVAFVPMLKGNLARGDALPTCKFSLDGRRSRDLRLPAFGDKKWGRPLGTILTCHLDQTVFWNAFLVFCCLCFAHLFRYSDFCSVAGIPKI